MRTEIIKKDEANLSLKLMNQLEKHGGTFTASDDSFTFEMTKGTDVALLYCTVDTVDGTIESLDEDNNLYVFVFKNDELVQLEITYEV